MPLPPLSLYVHFPWCVRKCPYCDFNSHTLHGELPQDLYIDALIRDLALQTQLVQGRELQSIFLGGGTPSLFAPAALARLFEAVRTQCQLAADIEITLEANPGTIERGRFADYRAAGVTRVSLGAQSFDDKQLQRLGRIHAAIDTRRAVEELYAADLANFNLDLMYGLPEQTRAEAVADIEAALALQPAHVSHYQLTMEPGTVFAAKPPPGLPDDESGADMQLACQERLAQAGFVQYEVSAYARDHQRCRHNLNYWEFGDYLGVGAGAHGKSSQFAPEANPPAALLIERSVRMREPRRYLAELANPPARLELRPVPAADVPFEYMLNALRLNEGFERGQYEARTGLAFDALAARIDQACRRGLMQHDGRRLRASARGLSFLNDLQSMFLP
jgi:oxygen-independent coproporphyrinogen-3 oxidase